MGIYINTNDEKERIHRERRKMMTMTFARSLTLGFGLTATKAHAFSDFLALAKQRRALRRLDARAMRDMGLTRTEIERESRRPVWDVPATWRHQG